MESLYNLLREFGIEAEHKGRQELSSSSKMMKAFFEALTPVIFNIRTEQERYHFIFQKNGAVSLHPGLLNSADVTLSGPHSEVLYLLETRDKKRFEMNERKRIIRISATTFKGIVAASKLRKLFK
jgi:hypothetical protein